MASSGSLLWLILKDGLKANINIWKQNDVYKPTLCWPQPTSLVRGTQPISRMWLENSPKGNNLKEYQLKRLLLRMRIPFLASFNWDFGNQADVGQTKFWPCFLVREERTAPKVFLLLPPAFWYWWPNIQYFIHIAVVSTFSINSHPATPTFLRSNRMSKES